MTKPQSQCPQGEGCPGSAASDQQVFREVSDLGLVRLRQALIRSGAGWASSGTRVAASLPRPRRPPGPAANRLDSQDAWPAGSQQTIQSQTRQLPIFTETLGCEKHKHPLVNGGRTRSESATCPSPAPTGRALLFRSGSSLPETQRVLHPPGLVPCIPPQQTPVSPASSVVLRLLARLPGLPTVEGRRLMGSLPCSGSQNALSGATP